MIMVKVNKVNLFVVWISSDVLVIKGVKVISKIVFKVLLVIELMVVCFRVKVFLFCFCKG